MPEHSYESQRQLALFCQASKAQNAETVLTIVGDQWYPMHFVDERGKPGGALYEAFMQATSGRGLSIEYQRQPFARSLKTVREQANVVMLSVTRLPERESDYQWLALFYEDRSIAVGLKRRSDLRVQSRQDLAKLDVGLVRGYPIEVLEAQIDTPLNQVIVPNEDRMWALLFGGRVDYVMALQKLSIAQALAAGFDGQAIRNLISLDDRPYRVHAITGAKTHSAVVKTLSDSLTQFLATPAYQAILEKWQIKALPVGTAP